MKPVFFLPHLGLGDHFTFNGALREIYKEYNYMVMPVKENEQKLFKECFENLKEGEYVFLHDDPTRYAKICKDISHKDTLIFVHDYRQRYNKENYKEIKNYLSFISEVENLTLFKIKK